jgi:hypothetical protein
MNPTSSPPTIETDLPCINCGYNLRTLPLNGKCPECAEAIWRTRCTRPDFRAFRRFETGQWIYSLAVVTCFCSTWFARASMPHTTNTADPAKILMREMLATCEMASMILLLVGLAWVLVSRYPRRSKLVWTMIGSSDASFVVSSFSQVL